MLNRNYKLWNNFNSRSTLKIHTPRNLGKKPLREIKVGQKPPIKTPMQEKLFT